MRLRTCKGTSHELSLALDIAWVLVVIRHRGNLWSRIICKTTVALHAVAQAQKEGYAFIDVICLGSMQQSGRRTSLSQLVIVNKDLG